MKNFLSASPFLARINLDIGKKKSHENLRSYPSSWDTCYLSSNTLKVKDSNLALIPRNSILSIHLLILKSIFWNTSIFQTLRYTFERFQLIPNSTNHSSCPWRNAPGIPNHVKLTWLNPGNVFLCFVDDWT